jgi:hypothetical protein
MTGSSSRWWERGNRRPSRRLPRSWRSERPSRRLPRSWRSERPSRRLLRSQKLKGPSKRLWRGPHPRRLRMVVTSHMSSIG